MAPANEKNIGHTAETDHGQPASVTKYWKVESAPFIHAINAADRLLGPWGTSRLDVERLMAEACRSTGLEDFGEPAFDEPFARLVSSMKAEARLNLIGRLASCQDLLRLLVNRLRLQADRKLHPGISEVDIKRPLIVTGLPRTGTTLLHRLLALDAGNRVALNWESMYPSPPPEAATYDTDPRIRRVDRQLGWFNHMVKNFNRIHPLGARFPEECLFIFSHSFLSYQFETTHRMPGYLDWLLFQDLGPAYTVHRQVLQHLQWHCPKKRWVLKAPSHLFDLEALFSVYPDADIVMIHRDPLEVTASNASLTATLRRAFSDQVDLAELGMECTRRWAEAIYRAMRTRDSGRVPADRFLDIYYVDLLSDPLGTVKKIYTRFELGFPPEMEETIQEFLHRNTQNRFGRHRYRLEDFGLDTGEEVNRYAEYRQRFHL